MKLTWNGYLIAGREEPAPDCFPVPRVSRLVPENCNDDCDDCHDDDGKRKASASFRGPQAFIIQDN